MNRIFVLPLLAAAVSFASPVRAALPTIRGDLIYDGIPDRPPEAADTLDAYLSARQATPLGFTPKGQLLIVTRFGEVDQLHLVDHPLGARRQITFLSEPVTRAAFSPDAGRDAFLFERDTGGDGRTQIYYQRLDEPGARRLTDGRSTNGGAIWSNSGREIAFFTTARDGMSYDIDIVDPLSGTLPHLAFSGDGGAWRPLDWSADDRRLLVLKHVSALEDHLYIVDLGSGQKHEVDAAPSQVAISAAKFSRDGTGVYILSDRDGDNAKVRYLNIFTGEKIDISGRSPWDVEEFALSADGRYLAYVTDEGGLGKLDVVDLHSHQDLVVPRLPFAGVIDSLSFDRDGKRLAFGLSAANQPRDAYVLDIAGNRLEAWTSSEIGPLDRAKFVPPRLTQFPTFDRVDGKSRELPIYVYEPARPGPHPVLLMLHDQPDSQFRPAFDPFIQYVVNELGFAVLAPNVRGSSGYGKSFRALDLGLLREDAVKDVGALLVWIGLDPRFDARHVVVSGGYLALASLENYGDRLRGAVDFAGITDFVGLMSTTAPYLQGLERAEFGDERDTDMRAYLRRISPLTGADRISKPLLEVHGRNDPRVPISQSDELANRLRSRGSTVWILKAGDEGHAFLRQQDREAYYRTFAAFLASMR
ncbi:MAG TPA: prolyl oligopeptidase family serine peptidase [Steroidobacteraceae bacterium]|nr:prolyl oligopeptidase family serine peptidase [Steroidobacteraceae bacterium]